MALRRTYVSSGALLHPDADLRVGPRGGSYLERERLACVGCGHLACGHSPGGRVRRSRLPLWCGLSSLGLPVSRNLR